VNKMNRGFNTQMIGEIIEYFPETQTATIKLHMQLVIETEGSNYTATKVAELVDVVVSHPKISNFSITTPVKVGDQCLVFFTSNGIEHWLYRNEKEYLVEQGRPEPASRNRYSIDDAIALVGISSMIDPIRGFNPDDVEIRNADNTQRVSLKPDGSIEIETNTYDSELNPKVEEDEEPPEPAKIQIKSNINLTKEGVTTLSNIKYSAEEEIETSSRQTMDSAGNIKLDSLVTDTNQTFEIKPDKTITMTTGDSVVTLNHDGTINMDCKIINATATESVTVDTPIATFTSNVQINGNASINGKVDAGGKVTSSVDCVGGSVSLVGHTHIGSPTSPVGPITPTGTPLP
jgi:hypothetical protein